MSAPPFPRVDVTAVAITRGKAYLTVYNENWGAFTLPMSKPRIRGDASANARPEAEDSSETATRVACEALGRPLPAGGIPRRLELDTLQPYSRSGRDGVWKSYHHEVFRLELAEDAEVPGTVGGRPTAWMTLDEMERLKPVSPTAIQIAAAIESAAILTDGR